MKLRIAHITLLIFVCLLAKGSVFFTQFQNFSLEDGLSNTQVNAITEDDRGYIWVGTRTGLNRFDGSKFTHFTYKHDDTLTIPAEDVSALLYSKTKQLVVGTWDGGICLFDPITCKATRKYMGLGNLKVKSLHEDADTTLWITTFGDGVYKYNYDKDEFTHCTYFEIKHRDYFQISQGTFEYKDTIYITSSENGLGYIAKNTSVVHPVLDSNGKALLDKNLSSVTVLNDIVYLGAYTGHMYTFNLKTREFKEDSIIEHSKIRGASITNIDIQNESVLWLSTIGGLAIYDVEKKTLEFKGSKNDNVFDVFKDSREIYWVATWGNGLEKYDPSTSIFNSIDLGNFSSSYVTSMLEISDSIFLFGTTRGILKCNLKSGTVDRYDVKGVDDEYVNNNIVRSMAKFENYVLLISQIGVHKIHFNSRKIERHFLSELPQFYGGVFKDIKKDPIEGYWLTMWSKGAVKLIESKSEFVHYKNREGSSGSGKTPNTTTPLFLSKAGDYWLGTITGLSTFDETKGEFEVVDLSTKKGLPIQMSVLSIEEDSTGVLWLGTSAGLVKYDYLKDDYTLFTTKEGLPSNVIFNIMLSGNDLWLTCSKGLVKFSMIDNSIESYNVSDGLLSNELIANSILKSSQGDFFIGNNEGVNFFNPKAISSYYHDSRVHINDFFIDNKLVSVNDEFGFTKHVSSLRQVDLDYNQNNLVFEFSSVNFSHTQNELFAHQLAGFDKDWVTHSFSDRRIKYTNLDPGRYLLRIKAIHPNGTESDVTELKVIIKKPYWKQWWFLFLIALSVVFFVILIIYLKTESIQRQKQKLEYKVSVRTKEVAEQKNKIENMNSELLHSYSQLKSNVQYAKQIQKALLPTDGALSASFEYNFVFYQPKGIVSGDFYWITEVESHTVLATIDCTGHGVSGAFMTILTNGLLRDIIDHKKIIDPKKILQQLQLDVSRILRQQDSGNSDGMDISVLVFDKELKTIKISSAMTSVLLFIDGERVLINGDRIQIGGNTFSESSEFTMHEFSVKNDVSVYMYSDGFYDQFGGGNDMKYKSSRFLDFIESIKDKSMFDQQIHLEKEFNQWKGSFPQIDDVLVLGVKFK